MSDRTLHRRQLLRSMLAGASAGLAGATPLDVVVLHSLDAPMNLSPDAALKELIAGNRRCVADELTSIQHDLEALRNHTADKQEPFAAILACADSRVPVELIFDQTIGQ